MSVQDRACNRKDRTCKNRFMSFVRPESTIDGACNRKDKTCKRKATACNTIFSCLFYYKLFLLRILASQNTQLAREKTEIVRKDRTTNEPVFASSVFSLTSCVFSITSHVFSLASHVRPESAKDRACNRKDKTCKRKDTASNTTSVFSLTSRVFCEARIH